MTARPLPSFDARAFAASHRFRADIEEVPAGIARPLWSVMIPVFNCSEALRRSLSSVLAQAPAPELMQIEVVDDCSTRCDPEAVVSALGEGRVDFFRQPVNVGHSRNFNSCLQRARGQLVHILHGDDWVGSGFYERLQALFGAHPEIGAAFCRHTIVSPDGTVQRISPLEREEAGVLDGWTEAIAAELRLQPPSIVVRRSVYEHLGGFDTRMASCGEDWEMWVRIAATYPVAYEPLPLAFYEDGSDSLTKRSIRSGQNIRDVRRATRISRSYLKGPARAANARANANWADWALHWARKLFERDEYIAGLIQLKEALLCSRSNKILRHAARIAWFGLRRALRQRRTV